MACHVTIFKAKSCAKESFKHTSHDDSYYMLTVGSVN